MDLEEYISNCNNCNNCSLRKTATQVVPGDGNPKSDVLFMGEAPGANEDKTGKVFVGPAGKILDELLESIKLTRKDIFISNIVKCRPPNNRDPKPEEIKACRPLTNDLIKILKPKVFVLLGRFAMSKFFPEFKISQVHGNAYQKWGRTFVIMYHPAVALYNGNLKGTLIEDMQILQEILQGDERKVQILP